MISPRFSIVLPAHNAEETIQSAVTSAMNQTFTDFEAIVVDDGSTDSTPAILATVYDCRLKLILQEATGTPAGARNACLREARGEYVAFLDADDSWDAGKLERMDEILRAHPETDVLCHAMRLVRRGVFVGVRSYSLHPDQPAIDQLLYRGNFLSTSAVVARTSAVMAVEGFIADPVRPVAEDLDLWIRLASAGARFELIPDQLGEYRVGEGVSRDPLRALSDTFSVLDPLYDKRALAGTLDSRRALVRRSRATLAACRELFGQRRLCAAMALAGRMPTDLAARWRRYRLLGRGGR